MVEEFVKQDHRSSGSSTITLPGLSERSLPVLRFEPINHRHAVRRREPKPVAETQRRETP